MSSSLRAPGWVRWRTDRGRANAQDGPSVAIVAVHHRLTQSDGRSGVAASRISDQAPRWSREVIMLRWAVIFFVIAIVAAVLGFGGIAAGASEIARILFFIFLLVFVVTLFMGVVRR